MATNPYTQYNTQAQQPLYTPYVQTPMPQFQMPMPQCRQPDMIWVQGEAGMKAYMVAPNTRAILWDQICQDKIEAKDDLIAQLRSELMYSRGQSSQDIQTAAIQAGQRALANEIEQYVLPTPRPAYIVQNPNCCQQFGNCA